MKKFFFIIVAVFGMLVTSAPANAQGGTGNLTCTNGLAVDTLTNTDTVNLTIGSTGRNKFDGPGSFILVVNKISGTIAATARLQGSHNGTDWATIDSVYNLTDGSQTKAFHFDVSKYSYYRINVVSSGTMSFAVKGTWLGKLRRND